MGPSIHVSPAAFPSSFLAINMARALWARLLDMRGPSIHRSSSGRSLLAAAAFGFRTGDDRALLAPFALPAALAAGALVAAAEAATDADRWGDDGVDLLCPGSRSNLFSGWHRFSTADRLGMYTGGCSPSVSSLGPT